MERDIFKQTNISIRSIQDVKENLKSCIPEISVLTALSCYLLNPISIATNITFIVYHFYLLVWDRENTAKKFPNHLWWIGQNAIGYIEFVGILLLLVLITPISYHKKYYCVTIDSVKMWGAWSCFFFFYSFRPTSLLSWFSTLFSHHPYRLRKVSLQKLPQLKKMSRQLDDEIEHGEPCFSNKIMDEQREKLDENIAILQKKLKNTTITYRDELAQYTTWIIMCLISIIFLFLGILSLMLKITQLSFIHDKALVDYTIWDVISLLGFCNQLWNICDTNKVKLEQIYQFAFSGPRANYTRYMCQNICIFDSVIKNQLCESYGFRGFLIAMCLKPSLLLKIIVKPRYADENNEWIKCMNELNDLHRKISLIDEDENDIDIVSVLNELQQEEKEVKEQQPSTPFYLSMNKNESKYLNLSAFKRRFQKISIFANCKNCGHKLYDFFFF